MKLAEALLLRAELQKKFENLQSRILANIKVQENDKPLEKPQSLITEALDISEQLCNLINKINSHNNIATLPTGQTLSEAIIQRDMLIKKRNLLANVAAKALEKDYRLTHTEVRMSVAVSVEDTQKEIDKLSKEFRELDAKIQALNWTTDLG